MADFASPTIRTFQVFPDLPEPLKPLNELAHNIWWMWHPDGVELFRRLDRKLWDEVYHNPVKMLGAIDQETLLPAAKGEGDLAHLSPVYLMFKATLTHKSRHTKSHSEHKRL